MTGRRPYLSCNLFTSYLSMCFFEIEGLPLESDFGTFFFLMNLQPFCIIRGTESTENFMLNYFCQKTKR